MTPTSTNTTGGKQFGDAARRILERYVRELRWSLRGCRTVDPAEVEADVRQHIEQELADAPEPVSADVLRAVLAKLGSPAQWVPADDLPWWRRSMLDFHVSPVSSRWAIAVFVAWLAGMLMLPALGLGLVLLAASFLLARAMVAMGESANEPLGWRRWLVYPPLLTVYLPVLVVASVWAVCTSGVAFILAEGEKIVARVFEPRAPRPKTPPPIPAAAAG